MLLMMSHMCLLILLSLSCQRLRCSASRFFVIDFRKLGGYWTLIAVSIQLVPLKAHGTRLLVERVFEIAVRFLLPNQGSSPTSGAMVLLFGVQRRRLWK